MASGVPQLASQPPTPVLFARKFFQAINEAEEFKVHNLIVSPAAARSAMTLVLMATCGKGDDELRSGLILGHTKKLEIAKQHAEFLSTECVCNKKGVSMRLSTGLYVKHDQQLNPEFNFKAVEFFNAQTQMLDFSDAEGSMQHVNKFIERQTFHTVRDMLCPAIFHPESGALLVNSLFIHGKWESRFSVDRTSLGDFRINDDKKTMLPMMRQGFSLLVLS